MILAFNGFAEEFLPEKSGISLWSTETMKLMNFYVPMLAMSLLLCAGCSESTSSGVSPAERAPLDPNGNPALSAEPAPTNWLSLSDAQRSEFAKAVPTNWVTLNEMQRSAMVKAVNMYALKGGEATLPSIVQDLKPIEVYFSRVNVVIAMRREKGEEFGYYIQPWVSSHFMGSEPSPEWSFVPLSGADEIGTVCHAYRRLLPAK